MTHMKERLAGKIGNANNNAFMLRKLFKMYDTAGSGFVSNPVLRQPARVLLQAAHMFWLVTHVLRVACKAFFHAQ